MKLKNITGLLTPSQYPLLPIGQEYEDGVIVGYNQHRSQMGEVEISLNREKLALLIFDRCDGKNWDKAPEHIKNQFYNEADAIIAREGEIICVKKIT